MVDSELSIGGDEAVRCAGDEWDGGGVSNLFLVEGLLRKGAGVEGDRKKIRKIDTAEWDK